ncbi:hypothetical protein BdPhPhi1402_gp08 [Bdellovibrio phage phi1402]|uniref:hypothetical protein n=1 Tax=Bdellovibrio phage phi1402 TaxID=1035662 RepID=UPI000211A2C6|nr:hypothetical protein BdPhPhi1402_gp08 [Bdellovibrio phage phi1402]AEG42305.1 hypothetical protein [Bdellovibrio phage phi1402]
MAKKQAKREKNRVVGADISINLVDGEYQASIAFKWLHGSMTELKAPTTFKTILEASVKATVCIREVLPDLEKRLADAGVDVQDPGHGNALAMTEAKLGGETVAAPDKDVTQFSFSGEVGQMQCKCHKGKWAVFAFAMNPVNGEKKFLGSSPVKNQDDGIEKLEAYVMEKASQFLKENFDLTPEQAANITVLKGEAAAQAEALATAKIDNTVH